MGCLQSVTKILKSVENCEKCKGVLRNAKLEQQSSQSYFIVELCLGVYTIYV